MCGMEGRKECTFSESQFLQRNLLQEIADVLYWEIDALNLCVHFIGFNDVLYRRLIISEAQFLTGDFLQEIGHVKNWGISTIFYQWEMKRKIPHHSHFPTESFGCIFLQFFWVEFMLAVFFCIFFGLSLCLVFGSQAAAADGSGKVFGLDKWQRGEDGSNG